ncbi:MULTISPECIES: hypothetical protein [Corynebacterium]|jgi:hypothetical protein|uniref:Uncharacterized protein n=1 Tax=Corynebacterium provencense TaxID=1737425 RepID=A0A2Z3YMF0_9CORY|nr:MULTISPECIES: hypothetical protein [Corynebacterium]AWT25048.1 hypothetical protein Csp1_02200 [Corynebacterium provencense]MCI1255695.1 hypothetical protein [Corynebacterium provencense]
MTEPATGPVSPGDFIAQVVFRHNPTTSPQWSYYGINAPLAGSAAKLSEAKFAANRDLQFLSGDPSPEFRSYAEWAVDQETRPEEFLHPTAPVFVRTLQDEDTNLRLHRQNLAQAYLEGIRSAPELRVSLPEVVGAVAPGDGDADSSADGPTEVILVTLFPDDLLGDALLNLTAQDSVVFCLPDGDSLSFLPVHGADVWPEEGPGMLEQMGLDEFATVRDLMEVSDDDS